jgi:hypothetical protein
MIDTPSVGQQAPQFEQTSGRQRLGQVVRKFRFFPGDAGAVAAIIDFNPNIHPSSQAIPQEG